MFDFNLDNIAFVTHEVSYSYRQIGDLIDKLPLQSGKLMFCLCENKIGTIIGYLSALNHKTPVAMLDGSKKSEVIRALQEAYKPTYIWVNADRKEDWGGEILLELLDYVLLKFEVTDYEINPQLSVLLTTSGSTGSPKMVRLTKENLLSNAQSIAEYLCIDVNERPITSLPLYYSYGLSVINSHLIKGATILLTNRSIMQKDFWNFAQEQKATSLSGVPYTYQMLKRLRFFDMNMPYLKTLTQAGGKLSEDLAYEFVCQAQQKGKRFIIMYGQTEATARMSYLDWKYASAKYTSIGKAIPNGCFYLLAENGELITQSNIDGELVYEGPNVSLGYAEGFADLKKGDENQNRLYTGDIACVDEDGFYYITGRKKRFVKIWGNRCNLDQIEDIVKKIKKSCAVVGTDEIISIFVEEEGFEKQIINELVKITGLNMRAFKVQVISKIPKNEAGKTLYSELK